MKRVILLSTVLLLASVGLDRVTKAEPVLERAPLNELPLDLGSWRGDVTGDLPQDVLAVLGVDDYVNRIYTGSNRMPIGLYVGYYKSQREGDSIHSPLNCLPGAGWEPVSKQHRVIDIAPSSGPVTAHAALPASIEINRYIVQKGGDKLLVLYWYQSRGRVVASEYWGKIYLVLDAVRTNRTDGAIVRVVAPIEDAFTEAQADQAAAEFVRTLFPRLGSYIPS